MEDVIKQIIDMDRKAQQTTEAAQREKLTCEQEIEEKVRALREDYLQKARRRIRKAHYDEQAAVLEQAYNDHHDEWVEQIVQRVLAR